MSISDILSVFFAIFSIVGSFIAYYFQVKTTITKDLNGLISDEEDTANKGEAKKQDVVNKLYNIVPAIFRFILTKKRLSVLVQEVFDKIEAYAKKQI